MTHLSELIDECGLRPRAEPYLLLLGSLEAFLEGFLSRASSSPQLVHQAGKMPGLLDRGGNLLDPETRPSALRAHLGPGSIW
jgi:hypothetical protein